MKACLEKIELAFETLTPKQKEIAKYLISNYKDVAFMNSVELAQRLDTSNPTILRFANALGYKNYAGFQSLLHSVVQNELSSVDRIEMLSDKNVSVEKKSIFELEISNIKNAHNVLDKDHITDSIELLNKSDHVFIAGWQVSATLSEYSHYTLRKIREGVVRIEDDNFSLHEIIQNKQAACCALIFALPRYPNKTMAMIKKLHTAGVKTIVITDSVFFPYRKYCDILIPVPIKYSSFVDPISAVICLINELFSDLAKVNEVKTVNRLKLLEEYLDSCDVYYADNE